MKVEKQLKLPTIPKRENTKESKAINYPERIKTVDIKVKDKVQSRFSFRKGEVVGIHSDGSNVVVKWDETNETQPIAKESLFKLNKKDVAIAGTEDDAYANMIDPEKTFMGFNTGNNKTPDPIEKKEKSSSVVELNSSTFFIKKADYSDELIQSVAEQMEAKLDVFASEDGYVIKVSSEASELHDPSQSAPGNPSSTMQESSADNKDPIDTATDTDPIPTVTPAIPKVTADTKNYWDSPAKAYDDASRIVGPTIDIKASVKSAAGEMGEDDELAQHSVGEDTEDEPQYLVSVTYDIITPESAQIEEPSDSGYEIQDEPMTLEDVQRSIRDNGFYTQGSPQSGNEVRYETADPERDMQDGSEKYYTIHIKKIDGSDINESEILNRNSAE
jgi:hypothetical protein